MIKYKIVHYCERGGERRDCTVRALAAALNITYTDAHEKMASVGRKPKKGFDFRQGLIGHFGLECRPEFHGLKVREVLPQIQSGRFIVKVPRHVFAVVDGAAHDNFAPRPEQRVRMVYEVQR